MRSVDQTITHNNTDVKSTTFYPLYKADRNIQIYQDHYMNGLSYSKLAIKYGLTSSRVGQIVNKHAKLIKKLAMSGGESK